MHVSSRDAFRTLKVSEWTLSVRLLYGAHPPLLIPSPAVADTTIHSYVHADLRTTGSSIVPINEKHVFDHSRSLALG